MSRTDEQLSVEAAQVAAKRAELLACSDRIRERTAAQEADFDLRRGLFRDLIALGVRKAEIARWAGVSHPMVNDAIGKG